MEISVQEVCLFSRGEFQHILERLHHNFAHPFEVLMGGLNNVHSAHGSAWELELADTLACSAARTGQPTCTALCGRTQIPMARWLALFSSPSSRCFPLLHSSAQAVTQHNSVQFRCDNCAFFCRLTSRLTNFHSSALYCRLTRCFSLSRRRWEYKFSWISPWPRCCILLIWMTRRRWRFKRPASGWTHSKGL